MIRGEGEGEAAHHALILDGEGKRMLIVKYQDKVYEELTEAQMQKMKAQMEQGMARMKEQMARLTPEQRAQMEGMMGAQKKMMQGAAPEEKLVRAPGSKKIAGYSCDLYRVEADGAHVADTCIVPWADLKVSREEISQSLEAFRDSSFLGGARATMPMKAWGTGVGLPAWRKQVAKEGGDVAETTLTVISSGPVPRAAFAPPAGFTRRPLGER